MSRRRVNYDQIAPTYDRRFQTERPGGTRAALADLVRSTRASTILEAGCGTAHWLSALSNDLNQRLLLLGLDPSEGMLTRARQHQEPIRLLRATAECVPIADHVLDLVYCVNAIHHFEDPQEFIRNARRTLRPGGMLAVIGSNPRGRQDQWYVYDYFPGTYERDLERFPTWGAIVDWYLESGFERLHFHLAEHIHDPKYGQDVLSDPYLEKNATSQLSVLSTREYTAGIDRLKKALSQAEQDQQTLTFRCDIFIYLLVAITPN